MLNPINSQLASAAVYRLLHDKIGDIQSLISSFTLLHYIDWNQPNFEADSMSEHLNKESGFLIPSAVVREALISKGTDFFTYNKKDKTFSLSAACSEDFIKELKDLKEKVKQRNEILIKNLALFIASKKKTEIDEDKFGELSNQLNSFLKGKESSKFSEIMSEFLLAKNSDPSCIEQLQSIKEGNIFLEGLSQDITSKDIKNNFNPPLTLYLDTEILFHIEGLNGEKYQKLGAEFIDIVKQINEKFKEKPLVRLRFFPETLDELTKYFNAAKEVVSSQRITPNSGVAMKYIYNQCKYPSDVEILKNKIIDNLGSKGISVDSDTNYKPYSDYKQKLNLEDTSEIERLQNEFEEKWSQEEISESLRLINYIHTKRQDIRKDRGYLKIKHLLITGKGVTFAVSSSLGKDETIRPQNGAPFVSSLNNISNLLWLALNKQLISGRTLPLSMSLVTNAQIFISRRLDGKLQSLYHELEAEIKSGQKSIDSSSTSKLAASLYLNRRNPEYITIETFDSVAGILSLNSLNEYKKMLEDEHNQHKNLIDQINLLKGDLKNSESEKNMHIAGNQKLLSENEFLKKKVEENQEIVFKQSQEIEKYRKAEEERTKKKNRNKLIKKLVVKELRNLFIILSVIFWMLFLLKYINNNPEFDYMKFGFEISMAIITSLLATVLYNKSKQQKI